MEMKREELEIVIAEDGTVTIQVSGVKGKRCLDATAFLEEALGDVEEREFTSDYYQESEGETHVDSGWRK